MSDEIVVAGEKYQRRKGGWWNVEHQPGEWYPVQFPELLDEIERLRNAIKEHRHRVDDLEEYDYGIGQAEYNLWAMLDGVDNEQ